MHACQQLSDLLKFLNNLMIPFRCMTIVAQLLLCTRQRHPLLFYQVVNKMNLLDILQHIMPLATGRLLRVNIVELAFPIADE